MSYFHQLPFFRNILLSLPLFCSAVIYLSHFRISKILETTYDISIYIYIENMYIIWMRFQLPLPIAILVNILPTTFFTIFVLQTIFFTVFIADYYLQFCFIYDIFRDCRLPTIFFAIAACRNIPLAPSLIYSRINRLLTISISTIFFSKRYPLS